MFNAVLDIKRFASALLNIIFVTTPGFTIIFVFYNNLFLSQDLPKLILLSLSFITPFVILNFLASQKSHEVSQAERSPRLTFPIFASAFVIYTGILVSKILFFDIRHFFICTVII